MPGGDKLVNGSSSCSFNCFIEDYGCNNGSNIRDVTREESNDSPLVLGPTSPKSTAYSQQKRLPSHGSAALVPRPAMGHLRTHHCWCYLWRRGFPSLRGGNTAQIPSLSPAKPCGEAARAPNTPCKEERAAMPNKSEKVWSSPKLPFTLHTEQHKHILLLIINATNKPESPNGPEQPLCAQRPLSHMPWSSGQNPPTHTKKATNFTQFQKPTNTAQLYLARRTTGS